jgi:oligopeptidase A
MDNPLLSLNRLPEFSKIRPLHIEPALDHLLAENRAKIAAILQSTTQPTWKNLIEPIEQLDDRLGRAWSPVSHLNSVCNSPELRAAYNACLPKLSDYATEMGQNEALCQAFEAVAANDPNLNPAQRKMLQNALRDFHLSGVDLPADKKNHFKTLSQRLAQLGAKFEENVLDATHAWSKLITDIEQLTGLPESALALLRQNAEQRGQEGWLLTLEFPSYLPIVTYAERRELRRELYEAFATRASERGPNAGEWDNGPIMEEILALRHELAKLLDYDNYAELSLATKMASSTTQVTEFLEDLARRAKAQAEQELAQLRQFAQTQLGLESLQAWDMAYCAEKLRQKNFAISQEELRPYFPAPQVIAGLFDVARRLFSIEIQEVMGVDSWRPDVSFYEIRDVGGQLRGEFFLDLYARPHKRGGAWMDGCINRMCNDDYAQLPVAFLTCNFTPPVGDTPSLLTHDEVLTLFHEFGHGLHHLLTQVDYPQISGINGVAWDAVELPSQFMENWCWEKPALDLFAKHWQSGAALPEALFQRMQNARNFQSAMQLLRQVEFSLFDFRIHRDYDPQAGGRVYAILEQVRQQVAVVHPPEFNRFAHGFSHIFGGGYAAGYYSYKWAEVLSADAFSLFEEDGIFNAETGAAFKHHILEKGGSVDANELFAAFRGREPSIEPLLRHSGIAA